MGLSGSAAIDSRSLCVSLGASGGSGADSPPLCACCFDRPVFVGQRVAQTNHTSGRCCHGHGAHRKLVGLESAGSFVTAVASPHPPGLSALFGSARFAHAKEVLSRRQEQDSELLLDPPAEIQALAVPMD